MRSLPTLFSLHRTFTSCDQKRLVYRVPSREFCLGGGGGGGCYAKIQLRGVQEQHLFKSGQL